MKSLLIYHLQMDSLTQSIGEQIRTLRKRCGLTQEKLAEKCDISYTYLGDIERGRRSCTTVTLDSIVNALGYDLSEFFSFLRPDSDLDEEKYMMLIRKIPKDREELLTGMLELLAK